MFLYSLCSATAENQAEDGTGVIPIFPYHVCALVSGEASIKGHPCTLQGTVGNSQNKLLALDLPYNRYLMLPSQYSDVLDVTKKLNCKF